MAAWGAKTVRLEHGAQASADKAVSEFNRFEDAFFALQWLLARKASTLGLARIGADNGERVYVQAGDEIADTPDIWVLFSDTPDQVVIWDLHVVKTEPLAD